MTVTVEMSVSEDINQDDDDVPLLPQFEVWANQACLDDADTLTSIQILSMDEMQALNREFSGKDKPTNVLSFPMQLPEPVELNLLGDLALCAEVINSEAKQQHKKREAHWAHMVVHGMLHLQSYDHVTEADAETMESLEVQILDKLGYDNPYQTIA